MGKTDGSTSSGGSLGGAGVSLGADATGVGAAGVGAIGATSTGMGGAGATTGPRGDVSSWGSGARPVEGKRSRQSRSAAARIRLSS